MNYDVKAAIGWRVTQLCYWLEIALLLLMTNVFLPEGKAANPVVGVILILPLLPFAPFLLKRSIRAHLGLCFLTLFYFFMAVPSAMDPRYGVIARIELINVFVMFVITMCFARWEQRRLGISVTR